jgi:hypothetical protein
MGLFIPSGSEENSKNVWLKYCIRVFVLLTITALLTWYGKFYKPPPATTRLNDFGVWALPHKNGLGALVVMPNDGIDSNNVSTGLRIWLSPPDSLFAFERGSVRYRGKDIIVIGDSLSENLREYLLSTLDSSGNFYWLGPLGAEQVGEDVFAELKLINDNPQDYLFDVVYEGCKLRFFGSQTALDSSVAEPLCVAVLMFKPLDESEPPFKNDEQVQSLIWNGKNESSDHSRIALNYAEAVAVVSYNKNKRFSAKRLYFKDWNPEW